MKNNWMAISLMILVLAAKNSAANVGGINESFLDWIIDDGVIVAKIEQEVAPQIYTFEKKFSIKQPGGVYSSFDTSVLNKIKTSEKLEKYRLARINVLNNCRKLQNKIFSELKGEGTNFKLATSCNDSFVSSDLYNPKFEPTSQGTIYFEYTVSCKFQFQIQTGNP